MKDATWRDLLGCGLLGAAIAGLLWLNAKWGRWINK